ncbi:MAG: hypothetical protein Q8P49_04300 [Candidatus Liptonbacteria bacterium]|nr:hypothetical protein [Candidatus Liptonbacteria bacterium]
MPSRRNKRKNAYALSKLRSRLYKGVAATTLIYVVLSIVRFHGEFSYLPYILAIIWAVSLLCYTSLKEVLRWNDVGETDVYHGELWASVVVAGAAWMIIWNVVRAWIFNLPTIAFPEDYEAVTIETIVLYTLSIISSFLYKYKNAIGQPMRQQVRGKSSRSKHHVAAKNTFPGAEPASVQAMPAKSVQNPDVQIVLTKSPPPDEKNDQKGQS